MPKQFFIYRTESGVDGLRPVMIIELSYWEIFQILIGREVETITSEGRTVIRNGIAYSAFNMSAPADGTMKPLHEDIGSKRKRA